MTNSADPDQLVSWPGSTIFAKVGHIRVQQDLGLNVLSLKVEGG